MYQTFRTHTLLPPRSLAMENPHFSRWNPKYPENDLLDTAIQPYLTNFYCVPSIPIPPIPGDGPPPHFPAFPTNRLNASYKPKPEHAFQTVWDANHRKGPAPSQFEGRSWTQDDTGNTGPNNTRSPTARGSESRRAVPYVSPRLNCSTSRASPAGCRHEDAARKQRYASEPVIGTVRRSPRAPLVLEVEGDSDGTASSSSENTMTPSKGSSSCGDTVEPCAELEVQPNLDLQRTNARPRRSFFEVVLNPTEDSK